QLGKTRPAVHLNSLRTFWRQQRAFANFNITTLVCWFGAWGALPLYTIYFVSELQFSNSWLGLNGTLAQVAVLISAPFWNRLIQRKGNLWIVLRTVLLTGLYPFLIVFFPASIPILAFGFLNTLNDAGLGIAHSALFLDIIPPAKRSSYIAGHIVLMNAGAMVAPLISTALSSIGSVELALLACGMARFTGGALFWILPPVNREPPSSESRLHDTARQAERVEHRSPTLVSE
ncbi:MAG: MFS transporter, partial [Anaerolineae bacterium]|nr:MFS transporter [Thermoflexales bacterium]MDW8409012.1 MFS transporter [Anaerolineae bacterium]